MAVTNMFHVNNYQNKINVVTDTSTLCKFSTEFGTMYDVHNTRRNGG